MIPFIKLLMIILRIMILTSLVMTGWSKTPNSRRYKQLCPEQNLSLPCDPPNLDGFMASNLNTLINVTAILSKAFIPGGCYHSEYKYCPALLRSCLSALNIGYNWTVQGVCVHKYEDCPRVQIQEMCADIQCSAEQYLCHPQGCLPHISHCNGACPNLSFLSSNSATQQSKHSSLDFISQKERKFQRRILCGNSCLTKEEARNKYHCGGVCQVKSDPCRAADNFICPQHFILCGSDTCIDRFLQDKAVAATGHPEFFSCGGLCTHHSLPCFSPSNQTLGCQAGYWLCEDQTQCVLRGFQVKQVFFSNLCDGHTHCKDGSDEAIYECFQVYFYETVFCTFLLVVVLPFLLALLYCYRGHLPAIVMSVFTRQVDVHGKSYHRNEGFTDYFPSSPSSYPYTPCHTPPIPPPPSPANPSILSPISPQPESLPLIPSAPPLPIQAPTPPPPPSLQPPYPRFVFTTHPPESYQPLDNTSLKF